MHTSYLIPSHKNPPHLTILEGNVQAKLLELEFQIPQVLYKSTKSMRIGAKDFVANPFLWSSFIYIYMCVCVCVCVCVCFRIYILIWETNNYLRIFVFYSCSYAKLIEIKGKDKIHCIVSMEKDPMA